MSGSFSFFQKHLAVLNANLDAYWSGVATSLAAELAPVAVTLATIYVMLWGWSMMRGTIQEPITDGVTRIVRLAVVSGIALNMGYYNGFLANMLWSSPDALAAIVSGGGSDAGSNLIFLDSLMSNFYDMGEVFNTKANADSGLTGMPDFSLMISGLAIWVSGMLVTSYAAFLFVLSKIALSLLLGVGPLFVLMTMFESTKRFFDMWLGQALNYVFLVMLTSGVVKLVVVIINAYMISPAFTAGMADPSIKIIIPVVIYCIIAVLVMIQVPGIASALGGGAQISTLGAVGWLMKQAGGATKSALGGATNVATGKTLSDYRSFQRRKEGNAQWAKDKKETAAAEKANKKNSVSKA